VIDWLSADANPLIIFDEVRWSDVLSCS